jgi:hypothetical protein
MKRISRIILMLACLAASPALADDVAPPDSKAPLETDETHPIYSTDAHWVITLSIAIGGLFLAALIVGQVVKTEAPDVVPVAMSHEEDPAADRLGHAEDLGKPQ